MARVVRIFKKRLLPPKYVPSLKGVMFYFYLGLIALFLNQDYFAFNEETFLALNSIGFFSTLGFVLRAQVGKLFFFRAHRIFRVFRYIYRIGFRWLRKSVRVAYIGQWYVKQFLFSTDYYHRHLWRRLISRYSRYLLSNVTQQLTFYLFSATMVASTRKSKRALPLSTKDLEESPLSSSDF